MNNTGLQIKVGAMVIGALYFAYHGGLEIAGHHNFAALYCVLCTIAFMIELTREMYKSSKDSSNN